MKKVFAAVSLLSLIAAGTIDAKKISSNMLKKMYQGQYKETTSTLQKLEKEYDANPTADLKGQIYKLRMHQSSLKKKIINY